MSTHTINQARRTARTDTPRLVPGRKLWHVPIRWWEPEDYPPEPVTVVRPAPDPYSDRQGSAAYCYDAVYGHNVYLDLADLFTTERAGREEMAARTTLMAAEDEACTNEIVRRSLAGEFWLDVLLEVAERRD